MSEDTTTVEVKHDTWNALDLRKDRGESFDDVIRRLVSATGTPVGAVKEDAEIDVKGVEEVDAPAGATCSHYDLIGNEMCGDTATHLETMQYGDGDEKELYLCPKHAGADDWEEDGGE